MSKLVIYLIIGAVILIYNWIAGALKEHARRQEGRPEEYGGRDSSLPGETDSDPWEIFERNLAMGRSSTARAETHIREAIQPRPVKTVKDETAMARRKTVTSAVAEEGKRVTGATPDEAAANAGALEAERKRNDALRAHYDRWRQAMVDRQVLEQKF